MALNRTAKILIGLLVMAEIALLVWGIFYRRDLNRDFQLYFDLPPENGISFTDTLNFPSFPIPVEFEGEELNLPVYGSVATGRVLERNLRNRQTSELLGTLTAVEVVTSGLRSGQVSRIPLVVQFSLTSDPERNVMPWVLKTAAEQTDFPLTVNNILVSKDDIARVFSRGSVWNLVPALDLNLPELASLVEYEAYLQRYYGGLTYEEPGLLRRLLSRSWFPVVLDIAPLAEEPAP